MNTQNANVRDLIGSGNYGKNLGVFSLLSVIFSVILLSVYGNNLNGLSQILSMISNVFIATFLIVGMLSFVREEDKLAIRENAYTIIQIGLFFALADIYIANHQLIESVTQANGTKIAPTNILFAFAVLFLSYLHTVFFVALAYFISFIAKKFLKRRDARNGFEIACIFIFVMFAYYATNSDIEELRMYQECLNVASTEELKKLCLNN